MGNPVIIIIILLASIVIAISLHEMMHAWTSYKLGDDTAKGQGRISINPLSHIDPFTTVAMPIIFYLLSGVAIGAARPVPFNPHALRFGQYGMALVALAGPLTNLALAIVGSLAYHFIGDGSTETLFGQAFKIFTDLNVGLFLFNMLPIPPLDGSRVFYVFMPDGIRAFMDGIERMGFLFLLFFLLIAFQYLGLGEFMFRANEFVLKIFF